MHNREGPMDSGRNFELLTPLLNVNAALQRLGGDVELFDQIVLIYLEDAPALLHTARQSLANGNAIELRRAAHSLKGMMSTLGAPAGDNAALRLEQCAASSDLASASELIFECGERVAELARVLDAYYQSAHAPNSDATVSGA
jgi:two-component system sensor histidine kinase/response regulator